MWSSLVQEDIGDRVAANPANRPLDHLTSARPGRLIPLSLWATQSARNRSSTAVSSVVVGATAYSRVLMPCIGLENYKKWIPSVLLGFGLLPTLVLSCEAVIYGAFEVAVSASGTRFSLIPPDITLGLLELIHYKRIKGEVSRTFCWRHIVHAFFPFLGNLCMVTLA